MGAIAAALVGAVLLAIPHSPAYKKPTLGLDLQGGIEVVLRAVPERGTTLSAAGMQTAQQIMTSRVDKLGVTSPNVAIQGGNEIVIQLAGIHDPNKAAKIIGTTGQLQFFDFEKDLAPPTVSQGRPTPASSLFALLTAVKSEAKKGSPTKSLRASKNAVWVAALSSTPGMGIFGYLWRACSSISARARASAALVLSAPMNEAVASGAGFDIAPRLSATAGVSRRCNAHTETG